MADTSAADTKAAASRPAAQPRGVPGALSYWLLPRAQALHHLLPGVPRGGGGTLLLRLRQLSLLHMCR